MQTYTGSCHCEKVRYKVSIENFDGAITCNCSICHKRGWILTFVPVTDFELTSGEDTLTHYHFNKNIIDHLFCQTCGVASFGRGKDQAGNETIAINVRCLDNVDITSLHPQAYNGKDI